MGEAFNRLINYFSTGDNYDKLLWIIFGLLITAIFNFMKSQLNKLVKLAWKYTKKISSVLIVKIKKFPKCISERIKYRLTIRKIEKGEMEVPPYFLIGKTRANNPELTKIFSLIDQGILEEPAESKLARHFEENPVDWDKVLSSQIDMNIYVKTPDCIKNFKIDK